MEKETLSTVPGFSPGLSIAGQLFYHLSYIGRTAIERPGLNTVNVESVSFSIERFQII